jgi:hypothetical protein
MSELLTEHEVTIFDFQPEYPCIVILEGSNATGCVTIGDFFPESADILNDIITSLNWHRDIFENAPNPASLDKLTKCQKYLTHNLDALAHEVAKARQLVIDLEHRRMRVRASHKIAQRASGLSASDAEDVARTKSEGIDLQHVAAVGQLEEIKGLLERVRSTLIAIAQDRKALQHQLERSFALSNY